MDKFLNLRRFASSPKKLFLVLFFVFGLLFAESFVHKNSFEARVSRVIDGDTLEIRNDFKRIRVRIYGIDAPEQKQKFGKESKARLVSLVQGRRVSIVPKNRDKYGRLVAAVKFGGKDVGREMVVRGWAWADDYFTRAYLKEQKIAMNENRGLWQDKKPMKPYEWRKKFKEKM